MGRITDTSGYGGQPSEQLIPAHSLLIYIQHSIATPLAFSQSSLPSWLEVWLQNATRSHWVKFQGKFLRGGEGEWQTRLFLFIVPHSFSRLSQDAGGQAAIWLRTAEQDAGRRLGH